MNLKKILAIGLSLSVALGVFGCSNKSDNQSKDNTTNSATTNDTNKNKYEGTEYYRQYNDLYSTNITPLNNYTMYGTVEGVNNNYKNKEYPGNEKYLTVLLLFHQKNLESPCCLNIHRRLKQP